MNTTEKVFTWAREVFIKGYYKGSTVLVLSTTSGLGGTAAA